MPLIIQPVRWFTKSGRLQRHSEVGAGQPGSPRLSRGATASPNQRRLMVLGMPVELSLWIRYGRPMPTKNPSAPRPIRVGVDTGGTFTDFVMHTDEGLQVAKRPSTPDDPARAVLKGLETLVVGPGPLDVRHGTTVGTNAGADRERRARRLSRDCRVRGPSPPRRRDARRSPRPPRESHLALGTPQRVLLAWMSAWARMAA